MYIVTLVWMAVLLISWVISFVKHLRGDERGTMRWCGVGCAAVALYLGIWLAVR